MFVLSEKKKYSIKETTKVEREKIVQDAYAIAVSTGASPTDEMMNLVEEYIDGKKKYLKFWKKPFENITNTVAESKNLEA